MHQKKRWLEDVDFTGLVKKYTDRTQFLEHIFHHTYHPSFPRKCCVPGVVKSFRQDIAYCQQGISLRLEDGICHRQKSPSISNDIKGECRLLVVPWFWSIWFPLFARSFLASHYPRKRLQKGVLAMANNRKAQAMVKGAPSIRQLSAGRLEPRSLIYLPYQPTS
jgi:hypothetical protein